jgi:hypothetical protein
MYYERRLCPAFHLKKLNLQEERTMKTRFSVPLFCVQMLLALVLVTMGSMAFGQTVQWSSMQVSDDPSRSEYAHIVTDSQDNHHIFWMEGRDGSPLGGAYWYSNIYYSKLDAQDNVLIDQQSVMTVYSAYCQLNPAVDSQDNLHIVWTDGRLHAPSLYQYANWEVYYKKLDNNGNILIDDLRLTYAIFFSGTPQLAIGPDDNVNIVWADLRHRYEFLGYWPTDVYYSKLDTNGNITVNNKRLTADYSGSGWPSLDVDSDGNIQMAHYKKDYIYGPNNRRVFYTKLDHVGNILVSDTQVCPIQSAAPNLVVDSSDDLHMVWVGTETGSEGDVWTAYYKKLDKYGNTLVNNKELGPGNMVSIALGPQDSVHVASVAYGNSLYYCSLDINGEITYNNNGNPIDTAPLAYINMGANTVGIDSYGNIHIVWAKKMGSNTEVFKLTGIVNQPPVAVCKDFQLLADQNCQALINAGDVDGGSYDPDEDDQITVTIDNEGPFSPGIHDITLTITDKHGASDTCQATVTVVDPPPTIDHLSASPDVLWPPNHKMVEITLTATISDNCNNITSCKITSVSSNEPVNGPGDGNTAPDWEITGDLTVKLRAERSGKGDGRIYTITVTCTDANGNSAAETVDVTVPNSKVK